MSSSTNHQFTVLKICTTNYTDLISEYFYQVYQNKTLIRIEITIYTRNAWSAPTFFSEYTIFFPT